MTAIRMALFVLAGVVIGILLGAYAKGPASSEGNAVFARDYGNCTWDATHDVSPCTQQALAAAARMQGRVILPPQANYFKFNVSIPANVTLDCQANPGLVGSNSFNLRELNGIRLESSATVTLSTSARLINCPVLRARLVMPAQTAEGFAGTAINTASGVTNDVWLENDLIVGFDTCVDFSNQSDRFHWVNLECDGINGYKIGPSLDSSEIRQVRAWPWVTAGYPNNPTNARSGTGFLFTGTSRDDDIKGYGLVDLFHAVGMDFQNSGGSCCNVHLENVWLDNNATAALKVGAADVSFGKLWIWASGGPSITTTYALNIAQLYLTGTKASTCFSFRDRAHFKVGSVDASGCTGQLSDTALLASSVVACSTAVEGMIQGFSDSNTAVWGATVAGGGTNRVHAYCNGSNWTVAAK